MTSRATTLQHPRALTKQRLSAKFWDLARGSGVETESRDPEAVVRHLLAVIHSLEGVRRRSDISADSLSFLLQLEHDPYYASPEQTRGGEKDSQSLVYSIGILLFERLTGHHPFVESLSPIHCAVVRDRSQRVGANNLASIPRSLRSILNVAMSPFPQDRWEGVGELRRELEGFLGRAETVLAPLPHRRDLGSRPPLSRAPTKPHARPLPTWEDRPSRDPNRPPTGETACERVFADGTGPHARQRAKRVTPPPPPAPGERAPSYDELKIERAESEPDLESSIHRLSSISFPAIDLGAAPAPDRSRRFVVAGLCTLLVMVLATVMIIVWAGSTAGSFEPPDRLAVATPASEAGEASDEPDRVRAPRVATSRVTATPIAAPAPSAPAAPAVFDLDHGGKNALVAARTCFDTNVRKTIPPLGASLVFSSKTGKSTQVYLATNMRISPTERTCLAQKLLGISAGAPPRRGVLVTYTLFLSADGGRAVARRQK